MLFTLQSRALMVDFLDDLMARRVFYERRLHGAYSTEADRALDSYRHSRRPGAADPGQARSGRERLRGD